MNLRKVREELRLGRVVVADRANVSRFKLWEFESGKPTLTPEEQASVKRVLGAELARFARLATEFERTAPAAASNS